MASYLEGGLSERDHGRFEGHLADCGYCLERVGMISRAHEEYMSITVPDLDLARAARLADQSARPTPVLRVASRWAAAAVIVLAIGLFALMRGQGTGYPPDTPAGTVTEPRATRSIDPDAMASHLAARPDALAVQIADGNFGWSTVPDSLYYQVRIVSDEGDLLWLERVEDTHWSIPAELSLTPGAEYFVRVDAFITESKSLNSDFVAFQAGAND